MTKDDWRNFGHQITERLTVKVEWARYLFDLRLGFKRDGRWKSYIQWPPWKLQPATQNFWNGIFTFNVYVVMFWAWKIPVVVPRIAINIRYSENHGLQIQPFPAILFDRGELNFGKLRSYCWFQEEKTNPDVNARGWEEGPI